MELKDLILIIISIILGTLIVYVIFRLFLWLLPIIIALIIAYFIYLYLNERY